MKQLTKIFIAFLITLWIIFIAGLVFINSASANDVEPNGVASWQRADGAECVTDLRNDGVYTVCDCPCDTDCGSTPNQTEEPEKEPTPEPDKTKCSLGWSGAEYCQKSPRGKTWGDNWAGFRGGRD